MTDLTIPQQSFTEKKMKMIFNILPSSYPMTQELLDTLLKTPIVRLEGKLTEMRLNQITK